MFNLYTIGTQMVTDSKDKVVNIVQSVMFAMERTSKKDYLSGPRPSKLGVVTNMLRSRVKAETRIESNKIVGALGVGGHPAFYGRIHEEGLGGRRKRPFLATAIDDHIDDLRQELNKI